MPAGVVPAPTATLTPRRVASAWTSWHHNLGSGLGAMTWGGGVGGQAVRCQKSQVAMVLAEVRLQGRLELGQQHTHCVERVVKGPLARLFWAPVCHARYPRSVVSTHIAQDMTRSWFWGLLTQSAHLLGHFWPFLGRSSDISWNQRAAKGSLSRDNKVHVEFSHCFPSLVCLDWVSGPF